MAWMPGARRGVLIAGGRRTAFLVPSLLVCVLLPPILPHLGASVVAQQSETPRVIRGDGYFVRARHLVRIAAGPNVLPGVENQPWVVRYDRLAVSDQNLVSVWGEGTRLTVEDRHPDASSCDQRRNTLRALRFSASARPLWRENLALIQSTVGECRHEPRPPFLAESQTAAQDLNRPDCAADPRAFTAAERARWEAACGPAPPAPADIDLNAPSCRADTLAFTSAERARWRAACGGAPRPTAPSPGAGNPGRPSADPATPVGRAENAGFLPLSGAELGAGVRATVNAINDNWDDDLAEWAVENLEPGPLSRTISFVTDLRNMRGELEQTARDLLPEPVRNNLTPWQWIWNVPNTVLARFSRMLESFDPFSGSFCEEFELDRPLTEWMRIMSATEPERVRCSGR